MRNSVGKSESLTAKQYHNSDTRRNLFGAYPSLAEPATMGCCLERCIEAAFSVVYAVKDEPSDGIEMRSGGYVVQRSL